MLMVPELLLVSVDASNWVLDSNGEAIQVKISLSFEEYSEDAAGLKNSTGSAISLTPGVQSYDAAASAASIGASSESTAKYLPKNSQMAGW